MQAAIPVRPVGMLNDMRDHDRFESGLGRAARMPPCETGIRRPLSMMSQSGNRQVEVKTDRTANVRAFPVADMKRARRSEIKAAALLILLLEVRPTLGSGWICNEHCTPRTSRRFAIAPPVSP